MDCVFCEKIKDGSVDFNSKKQIVSFVPLNPVTPGHRLFVPIKHFAFPHQDPIMAGVAFEVASLHAALVGRPYNLIVNAGVLASQTIQHVHIHYIPRREDDGLKLPWTDQEK